MAATIECLKCRTRIDAASGTCYRCGEDVPDYLKDGGVKCPHCDKYTAQEETCRSCGGTIPAFLLETNTEELAKKVEVEKAQPPKPIPTPPPQEPTGENGEVEPPPLPSVAAKTHPYAPADTSMKLLIRRRQKSGVTGKITFTLDVRVEVSANILALVKKYRVGNEILYYKEKVDTTDINRMGAVAGISRAIAAKALNVKITVEDLVKGKHIECKDIMEMRAAEEQIKEACHTFKAVLESAAYFDGEEIIAI